MTLEPGGYRVDTKILKEIERRILWLAVRTVDRADRSGSTIDLGGYQATSASLVSIMTALWFGHIGGADKIAVEPQAAPVHHAIRYLTGEVDHGATEFSIGPVGSGVVAPFFSAVTRRYVDAHFGERPRARFIATVGDADLDEGNVWEVVADPATRELGNVMLVVDLNRQRLASVLPDIQAIRLKRFFADAGWHVVEAKYGHLLQAAFARPEGESLRFHIDSMGNHAYQDLFTAPPGARRERFLYGADSSVVELIEPYDDGALADLVFNLGGHDMDALLDCFQACDAETDRPSVVFAYTVKGWSLPMAGDPLNHAALLSADQIDELRTHTGLTVDTEWDRFDPETAAGQLCAAVGAKLSTSARSAPRRLPDIPTPDTTAHRGPMSAQQALGRVLDRLVDVDGIGERLVTISSASSADGSVSARLDSLGRHIHSEVSEVNFFLLLGQLGLAQAHHGELLLPVGTLPDSLVLRGLDALIYSLDNDARFVFAGTSSGLSTTVAGGARHSTLAASVGTGLCGLCHCEPAYAAEVDWMVCDALERLSDPGGESTYLRLSARPVDQEPFRGALDRLGESRLRQLVLAGGYRLVEPSSLAGPGVTLVSSGAAVGEVVAAARELESEGVSTTVVQLTSPDRVYRSWQLGLADGVAHGRNPRRPTHIEQLVPRRERNRPVVSVLDSASQTLGWIGAALGVSQLPLGAERSTETESVDDAYMSSGISQAHVVNAALVAIDRVTPA